jgi:tetratricopeptide (TPR) repeat protein
MNCFYKLSATILSMGFALMQAQMANASRSMKAGYTISHNNLSSPRINEASELNPQGEMIGARRQIETLPFQNFQVGKNIYALKTEFGSTIPISRFLNVAPHLNNTRSSRILISSESSNPQAEDFFLQAEEQNKRGMIFEAIKNYNQAIRLDPKFAEAYLKRGLYYSTYGVDVDKKKAIEDFDQAMRLDPKLAASAYFNRGIVRAKLKDLKGAIADYEQAMRLDPKLSPGVYFNRGLDRYTLGDKQGAIADMRKAADLLKAQGNMRGYQYALRQLQRMGAQ